MNALAHFQMCDSTGAAHSALLSLLEWPHWREGAKRVLVFHIFPAKYLPREPQPPYLVQVMCMAAHALIITGESTGEAGWEKGWNGFTLPCCFLSSLVSEGKPRVVEKWVAGINIHIIYCCAENYFITAVWYVGEIFLQLLELPISSCLLQSSLSLGNRSRELVTSELFLVGECSRSLHGWLCTAAVGFWLQRIWNKLIQCENCSWPANHFGCGVPNFLENWNAERPVWRKGGN